MLLELRIENLLLIERAELRLGSGLNVITGETGAGKTVLAHALDLLTGGRARPQIVRPGASEAYVEGVFELPAGLLEDEELADLAARLPDGETEVVLARRVASGGRTSAYVQGRSANVGDLRALGARLLAFYGQHEHRKLTLASAQLEVLDGFAGAEHLARVVDYRAAHRQVRGLERERMELHEREGARERDLDLMRFELEEIEAAAPEESEREELGAERDRLRHAETLREAAAGAVAAIAGADEGGDEGAAAALAVAQGALETAGGVDPGLDGLADRIAAASVELADLASDLRAYAESVSAAPERLQQLEERLAEMERLERKHGGTTGAVLAHAERCRQEIQRLERSEEEAAELERRLAEASERRAALATRLTKARETAAPKLERTVAEALEGLAMEGARLEVELEPESGALGPAGAERVELRVATNPGMPVAPLRDAASGGELSRIMLALSSVAGGAGTAVRVFDEIDSGVGGATARAVGERLQALAGDGQVLCITHLPQVASRAERHFRISKRVEDGESLAEVERVSGDDLVGEIVRMLGAERTDQAATRHARELLAA